MNKSEVLCSRDCSLPLTLLSLINSSLSSSSSTPLTLILSLSFYAIQHRYTVTVESKPSILGPHCDSKKKIEKGEKRSYQKMDAYSSHFLSRPVEERLQQTEDRLRLRHLQQQGSIAKFNYSFDSLSANLDVPEDYLVNARIYGLKEEIAKPINPYTMLESHRLARLYEKIGSMPRKNKMPWKIKKKAWLLKNPMGLVRLTPKSALLIKHLLSKLNPRSKNLPLLTKENDDNHEVECVTVQEPRELLSTIVGGVPEKTQEATSIEVVREARTETMGSFDCTFRQPSTMERTREVMTSPSGFGLGFSSHELVPMCRKPKTWEKHKRANNSSGTQLLKSKVLDLSISSEL